MGVASEGQLRDVAELAMEFAKLCGKTPEDVMEALKETKALNKAGYTKYSAVMSENQAALAIVVLTDWVRRKKEKN